MIKMKYTIRLNNLCVYIFWGVLMVGKGLGLTSKYQEFRYITLLAFPFAAIKIICTRWTREDLIRSIFLGLTGVAVWLFSTQTDVLIAAVVIIACKDINIYKMFKLAFGVRATLFFARTSLAILGYLDMGYAPRYASSGAYDVRYTLGYGQPNATHYELFVITILALLLWHNRMRLLHYLCLLGYNFFVFQYTDSRTGMVLITITLALVYLSDRKPGILLKKFIGYIGEYAYIAGAIFSLMGCILYKTWPAFRMLGTFSSRFQTGLWIISNKSFSLFGMQSVNTDLGIINILYGRGLIVFLAFLVAMTALMKIFNRRKMYTEEIIGIMYAVYTMMESYTASILMNMILLFMVWLCYPSSENSWCANTADDARRVEPR